MSPLRRFRLPDLLLLLLVLALAGGARAGYLLAYTDAGRVGGPLRVQDDRRVGGESETRALVRELCDNQFVFQIKAPPLTPLADPPEETAPEETAHASPGYPYTVALVAKLLPDRYESTVRWAQCALGALTAGLYFLFARRAFRSLFVGTLVGLVAAAYPFWVVNTAALEDGVLATFLLALALFLGGRASQTGGPFASLLFGLTLAGLALVRAALLPFAFVAVIWFLLRTRGLARGWLAAVLTFLGFVTGLAPWTVRNFQVFHEPLPVVDSMWLHLWVGNNPAATGGPDYDAARKRLPDEKKKQLADEKHQPKRYDELHEPVLQELRDQPDQALGRRLAAALMFFLGEDWFKKGPRGLAEAQRDSEEWLVTTYPVTLQATLLGLLGLALLGWRWSYGWRQESMPAALAMIWVPLPYVLSHAEVLSGPRLPLDGVLICYAAFALACLVPRVGGPLREARGAGEAPPAAP
jgi:hypothetical protein